MDLLEPQAPPVLKEPPDQPAPRVFRDLLVLLVQPAQGEVWVPLVQPVPLERKVSEVKLVPLVLLDRLVVRGIRVSPEIQARLVPLVHKDQQDQLDRKVSKEPQVT